MDSISHKFAFAPPLATNASTLLSSPFTASTSLTCRRHKPIKNASPPRTTIQIHNVHAQSTEAPQSSSAPLEPAPSPSPLSPPPPPTTTLASEPDITQTLMKQMKILHQTDNWVAVSKPAGVLVHRSKLYHSRRGETFLKSAVRLELKSEKMPHPDLYPVHRLDRATTGVILFALGDARNAALLQDALQSDTACKQYWTLAFGASDMPDEKWENDHPLKDLDKGRKNRKQKSALTKFERLAALDQGDSDVAVIRATLATGRRHQIRRHLSYSRFPVLGDTSHGDTKRNHYVQEKYGVERLCLHARRLSFIDPFTKELVKLQVPVPDDLRRVVEQLPGFTSELGETLDLEDPTT